MNLDYISLKNVIKDYLNKDIPLYKLGKICENVYYDIIRGDYIYLDKLLIYPLLKKLYRINIKEDDVKDNFPCNESDILSIYDVLIGNRNESYFINIGIPQNISKKFIEDYEEKMNYYELLRNVLLRYLEEHSLSDDEYLLFQTLSLCEFKATCTIFDVLDNYILTFVKNMVFESGKIEMKGHLSLYTKQRVNQDNIIRKVIYCIDCYVEKNDISTQIIFKDGQPRLNIMIINF